MRENRSLTQILEDQPKWEKFKQLLVDQVINARKSDDGKFRVENFMVKVAGSDIGDYAFDLLDIGLRLSIITDIQSHFEEVYCCLDAEKQREAKLLCGGILSPVRESLVLAICMPFDPEGDNRSMFPQLIEAVEFASTSRTAKLLKQ